MQIRFYAETTQHNPLDHALITRARKKSMMKHETTQKQRIHVVTQLANNTSVKCHLLLLMSPVTFLKLPLHSAAFRDIFFPLARSCDIECASPSSS